MTPDIHILLTVLRNDRLERIVLTVDRNTLPEYFESYGEEDMAEHLRQRIPGRMKDCQILEVDPFVIHDVVKA